MEQNGGIPLFPSMSRATLHPCILVVEDETIIRMHLACLLEDEGFAVLEAEDSTAAMAILTRYPDVDVLVTDVRMPGRMDGLSLVRHTRKSYPRIRSIVVSGNAIEADAIFAGAVKFISKPYLPMAIVSAVRGLVGA